MWEYLIGILIALILGSVLYFVRMCRAFDCRNENGRFSLPWKGLIEPILDPKLRIIFSSYNAFIFIIPLIIISIVSVYYIKKDKKNDDDY